MKRLLFAAVHRRIPALLSDCAGSDAFGTPGTPAPQAPGTCDTGRVHAAVFGPAEQTAMVKQYCTGCHSDRGKAGQLTLQSFDASAAANPDHDRHHRKDDPQVARRHDAARERTPPGAGTDHGAGVGARDARRSRRDASIPNPGSRPFQRLNRAEYARAVKDMLGVDIDVAGLLPADTISNGFDNVADAQAFSATLMESYLRAAAKVTALAIGDKEAAATETNYRVPKTASQLSRVEGAPFGTRGGISVPHTFPADGDYTFKVELHSNACGVLFGGPNEGEQVEVSVDGERKAIMKIDPRMAETTTGLSLKTPQIHITAGVHRVTAAFIQRFEGPVNDLIAPIDHTLADTQIGVALGITTLPHVKDFSIVGPYNVTGISETASRRKIFTCRPTSAADEAVCAAKIVRTHRVAGVPRAGERARLHLADEVLHGQPQGRRLRIRDRRRDRSDSREPAVPVPSREHAQRRCARGSRIASAIWSWPRACRISSGPRRRMPS